MRKESKDKSQGFSRFLRYLKGEMKGKERNSLERELQADPFAGEAMEGYGSVTAEEAENDMRKLGSMLGRRTRRKNRTVFYRIAASVAVLMVISSVFLVVENRSRRVVNIPAGEIAELEIPAAEPVIAEEDARQEEESKVPATADEQKKEARQIKHEDKEEQVSDKALIKTEPADKPPVKTDRLAAVSDEVVSVARENASDRIARAPAAAAQTRRTRAAESVTEKRTSGVVLSSEDSLPVPGASVMIKGTTSGVVTDLEGRYSIPVPENGRNVTLVASFIGMKTQELEATADTPAEIMLTPDQASLSEIVVVGYGSRKSAYDEAEEGYSAPRPIIGKAAYDRYLSENIRRPDSASAGQRVVVVAGFRIRTDGSTDSIRIIRSPDSRFSEEAIRLIKSGPGWKPAEMNGKMIEEDVRLRIVFK
jgi:outer membrane biosynthesis protein TonB